MDVHCERAAKAIAGEITLSGDCSASLKRWRQIFGIKQNELARIASISPSVISDYESGRRTSPGTGYVKRFVESLIEADLERGGHVIGKYAVTERPDAILALRELTQSIDTAEFLKIIDGKVIACEELLERRSIRGYTVIDSIQAILNFSDRDFKYIYGSSTERALIFTKVKLGRSPMIAIKVTQPKPGVMVLHGLAPGDVDALAIHIAEKERIPLIVSQIEDEKELIDRLVRRLT